MAGENNGEFMVAWQPYKARGSDELSLNEGDVVELLETEESFSSSKKQKLDPNLDVAGTQELLDSSAARHKLSVKPKRSRTSRRQSPSRHPANTKWLVREVKGQKRQGWVPCQILQSTDEPVPGSGLPGDAVFRRQAVVKELVETEQEFVRDLEYVVQKYLIGSEREPRKPKIIKDNFDLIFGNLKEIAEFHRTVLMEGVKYYANEPHLLGKAFLRLERDFDKHVNYCMEEPFAQSFLETCDVAHEFFDELSQRLGDDKTISEHLKLPIQRINDYQLLLKELVRYSACLGEDNSDLQKALELMLSVPHRAQDDKFTNSIEGYRGSIHKLGRLIAHDWFSVVLGDVIKERYLFLFKARILVTKVRRISDDRSVFQLKDIIRLPQVEVKDHPENSFIFELCDKITGHSISLTAHRDNVKKFWLKEIREFACDSSTDESADELQIISESTSSPELATRVPLPEVVQKSVSVSVAESKSLEQLKSGAISKTVVKQEVKVVQVSGDKHIAETVKASQVQVKGSAGVILVTEPVVEKKELAQVVESKSVKAKSEESEVALKRTTEAVKEAPKSATKKQKVEESQASVTQQAVKTTESKEVGKSQKKVIEATEQKVTVTKPSVSSATSKETVQSKSGEVITTAVSKQTVEQATTKSVVDIKDTSISTEGILVKSAGKQSTTVVTEIVSQIKSVDTLKETQKSQESPPFRSEKDSIAKESSVEEAKKTDTDSTSALLKPDQAFKETTKPTESSKEVTKLVQTTEQTNKVAETVKKPEKVEEKSVACPKPTQTKPDSVKPVTQKQSHEIQKPSTTATKFEPVKVESVPKAQFQTKLDNKVVPTKATAISESTKEESVNEVEVAKKTQSGSKEITKLSKTIAAKATKVESVKAVEVSKKPDSESSVKDSLKSETKPELVSISTKALDPEKVESTKTAITPVPTKVESAITTEVDKKTETVKKETSKPTKTATPETTGVESVKAAEVCKESVPEKPESIKSETKRETKIVPKPTKTASDSKPIKVESAKSIEAGKKTEPEIEETPKSTKTDEATKVEPVKAAEVSKKTDRVQESPKTESKPKAPEHTPKKDVSAPAKLSNPQLSKSQVSVKGADHKVSTEELSGSKQKQKEDDYFRVSVDLGLNIVDEDIMSRKYHSAYGTTDLYGDSSSHSRSSARHQESALSSSYSTAADTGLTSTRYGTDSISSSKYGSEISLTGKYGTETTRSAESLLTSTSKYSRTLSNESERDYSSGTRRSIVSDVAGTAGGTNGSGSLGYTRRSERKVTTEDSGAYSYRRHAYGDDDELEGAADSYLSKRTSKSRTSIEEDFDPDAYLARRVKGRSATDQVDAGSYSYRRTESREEDDISNRSYKRTTSNSGQNVESEDRLAKFEKYSRKSLDVSERLQCGGDDGNVGKVYTRSDSNKSTSHESFQTLADTTKVSGKTLSAAAEEASTLSASTRAKRDPLEMAPPDEKPKFTKTHGGSHTKRHDLVGINVSVTEEEELDLKKPGFTVKLRDAELLEDTYLRFMIKVKGDPHPKLTFYKDGVQISDKSARVSVNRDHSDHDFYELVIPDVKPEDAGLYKCVAKNEFGEEITEAKVTVTSSKNLFEDLADKEGPLPAGEKPSFIWKRDGIEFEPEERFKVLMGDDEDSLALIFSHVKPEDAAMYTCVAQTSSGHISCSAELTVQGQVYELHREPEKPQLIIEKREALTTTGGSCILEMQVKGFPKPKIKVAHNGVPVEPGSKYKFMYEDDENLSLVIKNVVGDDAGTYEITAENELGKDIRDMKLVVKAPPKIKSKMVDTAASTDQLLKMTLEIEGIPKPTIQFYKDGKAIQPTEHMKIVEDGDKQSIVIDKTNLGDSGSYSVVLKNELAEVSQFWDLNIYCAPKWLKKLGEDQIINLKDTLELSIQIEAEPVPEVTWFKDDQEIKSDEHVVISKENGTYKLKISGAVSTDSAKYKVRVKNIHGTVEDCCQVDVRRKPSVTSGLGDMTVTEGDKNVTFNLKIDAFPKPTIKWYLDEIEVAEVRSEFTRSESATGAQLVIKEVNHTLSGHYSCKIVNDLGESSSTGKLTVHGKPRFVKQLKNVTVEEGATLTLEVEADCCPEASGVKWLRNGQEVNADARITITRSKERYESYSLSVNMVKYEEQGEYEIQVTNACGTVSSKSTVIVQKVVHVGEVEDSSATKFVIEEVAETPKKPVLAERSDIDEHAHDPAQQPVETDSSSRPQGTGFRARYNDLEIEEVFIIEDVEGPQPIVEEYHDKSRRGKSVIFFNSLDIVEIDRESSTEPGDLCSNRGRLSSKETIELKRFDYAGDTIELTVTDYDCPNKATADEEPPALPKVLDTNMKDQSQFESLEVSYMVKGWANPPPVATWTCDGKEIKPDSNLRMTVSQSGEEYKLDIVKLDAKDAGVYECKLSNPVGEAKQQATLDVIPEAELRRPKVKEGFGLKDQVILKKKCAVLTAVIVGDPVPEITWSFKAKEITESQIELHKMTFKTSNNPIENGLKECMFSLTIPKCERDNGGEYTITAKNKWGVIETSGTLNIVLAPEIEGPDFVKVVSGFPISLECIVQSNPKATVTWTKSENVVEEDGNIEILEDLVNEKYTLKVNKTRLSDEGYYKVYAKNEYGEADSEGKIRIITEKPQFITGLQDSQVEHGGDILLMVRADGLPRPDLDWYLNDKLIENPQEMQFAMTSDRQLSCTYIITDWAEKDCGIYKVTATNVVGNVETCANITMTQTAPSFTRRLERSMELNEEEPLVLKAKVTGSPKPTVAWFKDGEPVPLNSTRIKTEHHPDGSAILIIEEVTPADSGAYKLVVQNANGDISGICAVAVTPKPQRPKFTKCIKDTQVMAGEPLRLQAKVAGYPAPEIKWLKDGLPVRASPNVHLEHHPDGTVALVVDCVRPENAGKYTLTVSNKLGDISGDAKVEIVKRPNRPEFVTKLIPQSVVAGFPAKFEVKAVGFPIPSITWRRNGVEVISDKKHIKIVDEPANGVSFLILDACDEVRDALTYRAVAVNDAGEAETSCFLTVVPATKQESPEERPQLLHGLRDVITDEGAELKLEAPFTGNPIPSVEWKKDGEALQASDRILLTCDGKRIGLCIDHAVSSDAGKYVVVLSNPLGKDTSEAKATVHKVFQPPTFLQRFTDLQQLPSRDAKFPIRVSGVPQPEVVWTKDGEVLPDTDKYRIKRDGDACCLYVSNCQESDEGVYRATATNKEGQESCEAKLAVVKEIKTPKKIEPAYFVKRIGDTLLYKSMMAKFTACAAGIPEPTAEWYHEGRRIYPSERIRMERDLAGLLRLTIAGVDQDDLGRYTCKIFNEHGGEECSAELRFDDGMPDSRSKREQYDKSSGAPMPLSDPPLISRMTDRHCTLSWKPSIPSGPRAPVTYQLEMLEMPNGEWFTVRTGIRSCVCSVNNLEPFRDYKFRIRVENKFGISDPSPYAVTHREKLVPDPPRFIPYLPPGIDFRPETSPYFPKDFDIDRPPHDNMSQAPMFLRQEHDAQYGVKDQGCNLCWFVYGYPKPKMQYYFNDELVDMGGRFDTSYTRNGQATLFINKMLERDVGWYEAVASNEHGEARQRVRLEIAEFPTFIRRPDIEYVMVRNQARFEARIQGVPYPDIKWYKDWKPVASSSRIKIQFIAPDTTVLIINESIYKDEGLYSCSARNVAGSISASAMLYLDENDLEYNIHTYKAISPIKLKKRLLAEAYDLGDELGRGTQGVTYHTVERLNGRNYAAKILHGRGDLRPFMHNELEIMNQLRHRKLISLHDSYEYEDMLAIIIELAAGGELVKDYLIKQEYYTESDIAGYIRQILQGLQYMHEHGFGHMGLDIGDLLLSHPGSDELKIADFGLSRRINLGRQAPLKHGQPEYVSPECANGEGVGLGHDMWSVGIITFILLSGHSPFRGANDMETLTRVQSGNWNFDESWWSKLSVECRDFISKLLVFLPDGRMDVHSALRHPWLERCDKTWEDEYRISTRYLRDYYALYKEWYDVANCRLWFRRKELECAFKHPSKMIYVPGERFTPEPTDRRAKTWEDKMPSRSPLNYEIGVFKSESHYQNGPDTYLLQLRDVDFPCRLREYMKVAASRGPGLAHILSDDNGYDWRTPIIHERRRFTDIMDEEIDDERKHRINRYGSGDSGYTTRRLRREIGSRLDTYAEAEAYLESKMDGRLPFFREKPQIVAMQEGRDLSLSCLAVGEPKPIIQWFKHDAIIAESSRVSIITDDDGRSTLTLSPALGFDLGMYKVVARNKVGQTISRTRVVLGMVPDAPDSPSAAQVSDDEALLTWRQPKHDGHAPVLCYSLQYKLADEMEWTEQARNIDHEFYYMRGLEPGKNYTFRLAAKNRIGWSDQGVASPVITTHPPGTAKVQLSRAMMHLQQITDAGAEPHTETRTKLDYNVEATPVEWDSGNVKEHFSFVSELSSRGNVNLAPDSKAAEWNVQSAHEHYNHVSEVSRGKFSNVLKAIDNKTNNLVIVKAVDIAAQGVDHLEGEFAALRSLRHERIAALIAAYKSDDMATFVLEKLQGADVLTYLASRHEYTEQTVAMVVSQVLDGLQYLHWRGLCHLDVQPDNVVMCGVRSVQVKLVDLGCAHRVTKLGNRVPIVGHPDYTCPEILAEEPAFPQSDIWSLGVLTYVMLSGALPFRGADDNESRQNILFCRFRFEHLYKEVSQEGVRFVMMLFKRHAIKRPTVEECHENRWLLPTDQMIKKRERAVFLGSRLKDYSEEYHSEKSRTALTETSVLAGKNVLRSQSIQEELQTST